MTDPVTEDLLAIVDRIGAALELPPARALHLPPTFARGAKEGEFCALEFADGSIGLSYVLLGDTVGRLLGSKPGERIAGTAAAALAAWSRETDPALRTIGFAAINAISQHLFRRARFELPAAPDSIGGIDPRPGDRIAMVGWFAGLARRIVEAGADLAVLELDPTLAGPQDGYEVTLDPGVLAGRDKVLSTTTLLLNGTLDAVLAGCRGARAVSLVGPGGGCVPDPLFARGVTLLGGTAVVDRDRFVAELVGGRSWTAHARKYAIARDAYPGVPALLQRAR